MNDEPLPLVPPTAATPTVPPAAIEAPAEAPPAPATNPIVPPTVAPKDGPTTAPVEEKLHKLSETSPEKPAAPEVGRHTRLKAAGKYVGRVCGSALDRAVVLLIAMAILAGLKHVACACGLMTP